ncbi:unnamed protein product [Clonostachys rosea f. rosea IK726]|uniref:Uncharacterized protein n=1 Tax=Clonostachys rosea f. rosea IK726 TaxID=1349383 RepID=A0ACA9UC76_BIOOC|nr:unnamed protein product [Clonostachys rosea f. rosea IK726]
MTLTFDTEKAKAHIQRFNNKSVIYEPSAKTKARHDRIWNAWEQWATQMGVPVEQTWLDLALQNDGAMNHCQAFLASYFEAYTKQIVIHGPGETEIVRRVNSAKTMRDYWLALVRVADLKFMSPKRREFPQQAGFWTLTYDPRREGDGIPNRPARQISNWLPTLAIELEAKLEQMFVKRAATANDMMLVVTTVWSRSSDIICNPRHRVDFHQAVLLGGIGGWRPEEVLSIPYERVEIGWLRNASDPLRPWPVCNITIKHVEKGKSKDRIQTDQLKYVTFWLTVVPNCLICPLRLLILQALADQAFEEGYTSLDQILQKTWDSDPGVAFVPLAWKKSVIGQGIFKLAYSKYWEIWRRTCLVAGLSDQDEIRPYSLRVGAGDRLSGCLVAPLRNFILGHTDKVFERSYLPRDINANLLHITFQGLASSTQAILEATRTAFLRRDEKAPVYITREEWDALEEREDITELRRKLDQIPKKASTEAKRLSGRIRTIKLAAEGSILKSTRREYFDDARKLREKGLPTDHLVTQTVSPHRSWLRASCDAASTVGAQLIANPEDPGISDIMLAYLQKRLGRCTKSEDPGDGEDEEKFNEADELEEDKQLKKVKPRCLLGCGDFTTKYRLTEHVKQQHADSFTQAFPCPECKRFGSKVQVPPGLEAWCSHIARYHSSIHTPSTTNGASTCFLCGKCGLTERGLTSHTLLRHKRAGYFDQPFACPECTRLQGVNHMVSGMAEWEDHVTEIHLGVRTKKRHLPEDVTPSRKRFKVDSDDEGSFRDVTSVEASPDPHAEEEFWVTGRDSDYD